MMHLAKEHGLPFPVFTLDTGLLFPKRSPLKKRLEDFFGFKIESLEPDITVEEQATSTAPNSGSTIPTFAARFASPSASRQAFPAQLLDYWPAPPAI